MSGSASFALTHAPRHADKVGLSQDQQGRWCLSRTEDGDAYILNQTALALWELCDGETTVAEMCVALGRAFGVDEARVQLDVLQTLVHMVRVGLLEPPQD